MITKEQLESFCSVDKCRTVLTKPFNVNGHTYATNGHICVKIAEREEYSENEPINNIEKSMNYPTHFDQKHFINIDEKELKKQIVKCEDCEGHGNFKCCPECDGNGTVFWESPRGYQYDDICGMCNGGHTKIDLTCDSCDGKGWSFGRSRFKIGSKYVSSESLYLITQLDDYYIAPDAVEQLQAIPFKFNGGIGIIMPLRIFEEEK